MKISKNLQEWLLDAQEPYIQYNVKEFFNMQADRNNLLNDPFIKENFSLLKNWDKEILQNHSKPQLLIHRLALLADLGIKAKDEPIKPVIKSILNDFNKNSIPQILIQIPTAFGGSGIAEKAWMICDFPIILAALMKMGVENKKISQGFSQIQSFVSENGFRCVSSFPKFRGPGRKTDFCPYVNILAAKALSEHPDGLKSRAAKLACEALLTHWQERGEKKYFLFGIGTEFQKLKYPFVWYNILYMIDVLSRYRHIHSDKRFLEMVDVILSKADKDLRFKPESIFMVYKKQDFSNKKEYSRMITLTVLKILRRLGKLS